MKSFPLTCNNLSLAFSPHVPAAPLYVLSCNILSSKLIFDLSILEKCFLCPGLSSDSGSGVAGVELEVIDSVTEELAEELGSILAFFVPFASFVSSCFLFFEVNFESESESESESLDEDDSEELDELEELEELEELDDSELESDELEESESELDDSEVLGDSESELGELEEESLSEDDEFSLLEELLEDDDSSNLEAS